MAKQVLLILVTHLLFGVGLASDCHWFSWSIHSEECGIDIEIPGNISGSWWHSHIGNSSASCDTVCYNGGVFTNDVCVCPPRRAGKCCETVKLCSQDNGGCAETCTPFALGSYCGCLHKGRTLAADHISCTEANECDWDICEQNCTNTNGSFVCSCHEGYSLAPDEISCIDANECDLDICEHNCTNRNGSFICSCHEGYSLASDKTSCIDINECEPRQAECEHVCVNTPGSYICECRGGYRVNTNDSKACVGAELASDCHWFIWSICSGGCGNNQILPKYTSGSWWHSHIGNSSASCDTVCYNGGVLTNGVCVCPPRRAGKCCESVKLCSQDNGGCAETCTPNVLGSYCGCVNPWSTLTADHISCTDVNTCDSDICDHNCTNTNVSFVCTCHQGYSLASDKISCIDINECEPSQAGCEQVCVNTPGSYTCKCRDGYRVHTNDSKACIGAELTSDCHWFMWSICSGACGNDLILPEDTSGSWWHSHIGNSSASCDTVCYNGGVLTNDVCVCPPRRAGKCCESVKLCSQDNGGCAETCTPFALGSYCGCVHKGRTLAADHISCTDVNQCDLDICEQKCTNTNSSFVCSCHEGYSLASDKTSCNDINECTSGLANCEHKCVNNLGSFHCECRPGYKLAANGYSCQSILYVSLG